VSVNSTEGFTAINNLGKLIPKLSCALMLLIQSPALITADDAAWQIAFLKEHCVKCHGPDNSEGDVRLDDITQATVGLETAERWELVLSVLQAGQMPPAEEPSVNAEDLQRMIASVKEIRRDRLPVNAPIPRTPIRRMNRFQYNNAVVDLLELKVDLFALPERMIREHGGYFDPAAGKMPKTVKVGSRPLGKSQEIQPRLEGVAAFPQDLRAEHGFDNRADHLSLSPLLMESFLKLSRSVVQSRDFGPKTCGAWAWLFEPPPDESDARVAVQQRLGTLLTRAFRRPVADEILDRYTNHVITQLASGTAFTDAMKQAVSVVLASPRFLYLYDPSLTGDKETLVSDDFALASRMSFFLWGSIPDRELLDLAAANRLSEVDVLNAQINRMLDDKKVKRFCESFPSQWLQLERIISAKPDEEKFPEFYRGQYRASMHMMVEPLLLFETVLVEDRSILELIDSSFSYRSEVLTSWLETGQAGNFPPTVLNFTRVANLDRRQGGVITNPAVMTMTSSPERTKPITRGAWMATVIFNNPPDPPPTDVPPLPESNSVDTEKLTLREQLDLHRKRADCKGCHEKIDPLGFALENYGPTGVWRDKYENGRDVDSTGVLFRRHSFTNPVELKDAILIEKDRFTRALAKHLLDFALARKTGVAESPALDDIVDRTAASDFHIRALLRQIIKSEPFLQRP
jgi:Protein of unknown function (DUF1592)/Protein of unknown function (DUF1588)/Protein of unknown function (DUF1585)/Protein of unknown function (DUF1595)/Planctomycete cytochrome C/Protein of unknown function (DUF1587)